MFDLLLRNMKNPSTTLSGTKRSHVTLCLISRWARTFDEKHDLLQMVIGPKPRPPSLIHLLSPEIPFALRSSLQPSTTSKYYLVTFKMRT